MDKLEKIILQDKKLMDLGLLSSLIGEDVVNRMLLFKLTVANFKQGGGEKRWN